MATICPTVLAHTASEFSRGIDRVSFANRIQIDLSDGIFTDKETVGFAEAFWPAHVKADLHLMYNDPAAIVEKLMPKQPNYIIIHAEAESFSDAFEMLAAHGVPTGVALLPETDPRAVNQLSRASHCLIFGGNLGSYGGEADLSQLQKIEVIKQINSQIELGWDGGANASNVRQLVDAGIDVVNVGSFIQNSEDPQEAYATLVEIAGGEQ